MSDLIRDARMFAEGQTFEAPYPFVRGEITVWDELNEERRDRATWNPGVEYEPVRPDDSEAVCDGIGAVIYTVVATFKPGRYPARVFYTRQWRSPDGEGFGKPNLRVAVASQFRRLLSGYRHEYRLRAAEMVGERDGR